MILIQDLTVTYGKLKALDKISAQINKNEAVALLGLSGCGKSTLMKCMVGLVAPTSGSILWNNVELNAQSIVGFRNKIGYMPQDGGLFPNLTNQENILLSAINTQSDSSSKLLRIEELAELTQIPKNILKMYPRDISGGQKQRISLMRALFNNPDVLLLDEPFSALDPIIRSELQNYMKELLAKLHKTLIIVTHDIFEAHYLSDKILIMKSGKIIQEGVLQDFFQNPSDDFVAKFIGTYQVQINKGII